MQVHPYSLPLHSANKKDKKQCLGKETKNALYRYVPPKIEHRLTGLREKMGPNFWRIRYSGVIQFSTLRCVQWG